MEGDIILAHEFDIADVIGTLVEAPPLLPVVGVAPVLLSQVRKIFLGRADIFDRCIEPDIEDLVLEAGTWLAILGNGNTPLQIARDATVDQAFFEMLVGDGKRQLRPFRLTGDPLTQLRFDLGLQQIEVAGIANFEIARS